MNITKGPVDLISKQSFYITYFQSNAVNPDILYVNNKKYIIKPGLKIKIDKESLYRVVSEDIRSYRVYIVKNTFSLYFMDKFKNYLNKLSQALLVYFISVFIFS